MIAIATSTIGVYYYFKIILAMYFKKSVLGQIDLSYSRKILLVLLLLILLVAGIFPDIFLSLL